MQQNEVRFFLGTNTPWGFVSRFQQVYEDVRDYQIVILKGGPGSGKSGILQSVCSDVQNNDIFSEHIYCAFDPKSLDAVNLPYHKFFIADGTAPHVLEPKYPGAVETLINLGKCWDDNKLISARETIISLSNKCSLNHERAVRFIGAAASLINDSYRIALDCTDIDKISRYAKRLSDKEFGKKTASFGHETIRFLSAITPEGITFFKDTVAKLCEKVYVLHDEYGASSRILLANLRSLALERGLDIITCYCSLAPAEKIEHILIPSLSIGFVTSNSWHNYDIPAFRAIHSQRFTDNEQIRTKRQRLSFNKKAARELLKEASNILSQALQIHDELESYYINAMDYEKLNEIKQSILKKVKSLCDKKNQ